LGYFKFLIIFSGLIGSIEKKLFELEQEKATKISEFYRTEHMGGLNSLFQEIKLIDIILHNTYFELKLAKLKI
jgi:hypothetical protein